MHGIWDCASQTPHQACSRVGAHSSKLWAYTQSRGWVLFHKTTVYAKFLQDQNCSYRTHYTFDYKLPLTICTNLLRRYIYLQFTPASASVTRQMRGSTTVPPYIWSLATCWPVIHRPSDLLCGGRLVPSWWWCDENCIAFSDRTHSAPSLIISWSFARRTEPLGPSSQAAWDGDEQFCHCCFPCKLHSRKGGV